MVKAASLFTKNNIRCFVHLIQNILKILNKNDKLYKLFKIIGKVFKKSPKNQATYEKMLNKYNLKFPQSSDYSPTRLNDNFYLFGIYSSKKKISYISLFL